MRKKFIVFCGMIVIPIVMIAINIIPAQATTANIPDNTFKTYLNQKLNQSDDADITLEQLATIEQIELPAGVSDLEGIQYCTNLTFFRDNGKGLPLNYQKVGECTSLTFLAFMNCGIEDISFIANLNNLTYLNLWNNDISDISALKNLNSLTTLDLSHNHIMDMSPIADYVDNMTNYCHLHSQSINITATCDKEEDGFCVIENPIIGIHGEAVAPIEIDPNSATYDAQTNTFKIAKDKEKFIFRFHQNTKNENPLKDFENLYQGNVSVTINHPLPNILKNVSLATTDAVYTYDGTEHPAMKAHSVDENGHDVTIDYSLDGINWTSDINEITAKNVSDSKTITVRARVEGVYEGSIIQTQKLDIVKRNIILTSESAVKNDDGKPLTNPNVTVKGEGFAENEGASFAVTGSQSGVGSSDNEFTYTLNDNTLAENYDIQVTYGTLEVKPAIHTVTFINDDNTYARVNVQDGQTIAGDELIDQKMPIPPTKDGSLFKEWNTSADGKKVSFTETTVVNQDVTVYAIYSLKASPITEVPVLTVRDASIKQGEQLDLMTLVVAAEDKTDGDLTKSVVLVDDGGFKADNIGQYKITFKVTNRLGASTTKTATVTVTKKDDPTTESNHKTATPKKEKTDNSTVSGKLPKTGDNNNRLSLFGVSGLIILTVMIIRKRNLTQ
ncbi:leucine-rich repeat domain-containing protein [Streptococcus pacificus]|uniref:Leucine-rich repeat domain-containing protein n=1 Tax=Streptococcus pacificus TaxID=2740577 RepID=A0ABS0ZKK3_9STRE|nr:leucine-rich repeat domain-containing protein [Streptococcus pacificus]MBJ8326487.1 leucine-rich repeat domain-containing protein [Streptococcus pacificus]